VLILLLVFSVNGLLWDMLELVGKELKLGDIGMKLRKVNKMLIMNIILVIIIGFFIMIGEKK
jgi:hypothetical protein